jgi:hypothetical protein
LFIVRTLGRAFWRDAHKCKSLEIHEAPLAAAVFAPGKALRVRRGPHLKRVPQRRAPGYLLPQLIPDPLAGIAQEHPRFQFDQPA